MKKIFLIFFLILPIGLSADVLEDVLTNRFAAKKLSIEQQDSILNPQTQRYSLRYRNAQTLFRHSFTAEYYLWDNNKQKEIPVSNGPVRDAVLSPNGKYVVYAKGRDLYVYKVDFATEVAITQTEPEADVYQGITDWLYEEEFGVTHVFAFSPDSKQLAFLRLDETQVPTFEWQQMLPADSLDLWTKKYPASDYLRYPKAGEHNAQASVCVYDFYYKSIKTMQLGQTEDWYIPRLWWTNELPAKSSSAEPTPAELVVQKINRDQNKMELLVCNPKSTISKPLYREQSNRYYIDYELVDQWQWLEDNRFIALSEKDGYRRLYWMNADGSERQCLTPASMDVTAFYGYNAKTGYLYFQAAPTPMTRRVYALSLKRGTITPLSQTQGTASLRISEDGLQAILCYESLETPNRYTLMNVKNEILTPIRVLEDNAEVLADWQASGLPNKQFFDIPTQRNDTLHAYQIVPTDFSPSKTYPVVLMQYSGPASQRVLDIWRKRFGHYLASIGYIVVCADPRGTDGRGREWRNKTYMNLGALEAEDQVAVAQYMAQQPYVDAHRIAMVGWSYGGYQTIRTLEEQASLTSRSTSDPLIRCGVAVAPVTDWRLYDSGYTERFMQRPQVNIFGYDQASLLNKANSLTGDLLLIHGLSDDNVHAQNTWLMVEALVRAGKQFDMQIYPDDNHFLRQRSNYRHVHERILRFLEEKLK